MAHLTIPVNAVRAVLLIRHAIPAKGGTDDTRALAPEGIELCGRVRGFYLSVLSELVPRFGAPEYWVSQFMRALITMWEIFHPAHISRSERLNNVASMTKIQGGAWYKNGKAAGKSDIELIREVIADPELQRDQPFDEGREAYHRFIRGAAQSPDMRLMVVVGHEPHVSHAAEGLLQLEQLGFKECESVVFYLDAEANIIGGEKLIPA